MKPEQAYLIPVSPMKDEVVLLTIMLSVTKAGIVQQDRHLVLVESVPNIITVQLVYQMR